MQNMSENLYATKLGYWQFGHSQTIWIGNDQIV